RPRPAHARSAAGQGHAHPRLPRQRDRHLPGNRSSAGPEPAAPARALRPELCGERGPPERTLTWQAMEQMRFLRRELPEEWPVERLALGFGVSPDVVRRVLRSRSCPPPRRRQRQDEKVLGTTATPAPGQGPGPTAAPGSGRAVRAPDSPGLSRLPRGRDGMGRSGQ
ncbi:NGRN protein, partial [Urocolius indicus]|nr:NGRN protein [Urocolius indicus]